MAINSSFTSYDLPSLLTTKGDILVHNGTTLARVAAGTNGYALTAASSQISGTSWSVAPAGATASYVPIAQAVITSATGTVSIENIPNSYKAIGIVAVSRDTSASAQRDIYIRFNSSTASEYSYVSRGYTSGSGYNFQGGGQIRFLFDGVGSGGSSNFGYLHAIINQYASTTAIKYGLYYGGGAADDTIWNVNYGHFAWNVPTSAISSVQFMMSTYEPGNRIAVGSNFYVYGLK